MNLQTTLDPIAELRAMIATPFEKARAIPTSAYTSEVMLQAMIADFGMADYVQTFQETHRWNTNWKVLGEKFMESYHLPGCHGLTIGGYVSLEEMDCPAGQPAFNWHTILKDPGFKLSVAHPSNTRLEGERRRTSYLITAYPALFHAGAGLFLVSVAAPGRRRPRPHPVRRRHVARLRQRPRGAGDVRRDQGAAGRGQ